MNRYYDVSSNIRITRELSFADILEQRISKPDAYRHIVWSWILKPVEKLMAEPINTDNGMAIFSLELIFFEPHGECLTNLPRNGHRNFNEGYNRFKVFLLNHNYIDQDGASLPAESIYQWARCGLFHAGRLADDLLVDAVDTSPYVLCQNPLFQGWLVDPWKLAGALGEYVDSYVADLEADTNSPLYSNFEATFRRMIEDPAKKYACMVLRSKS